MLLNRDTAEGIANGNITLVLRRWDVPRAKAGGTQRTSAGTIRIDAVTQYPGRHRVTAAQARAAGYPDAKSAQADLDRKPARQTYVIEVSYLAPDERPDLAADDHLSDSDVDAITARLKRWDTAATDRRGPAHTWSSSPPTRRFALRTSPRASASTHLGSSDGCASSRGSA